MGMNQHVAAKGAAAMPRPRSYASLTQPQAPHLPQQGTGRRLRVTIRLRAGAEAFAGSGAAALTLDLTLCGNDLLLDTFATLHRLCSLHRDTLQVVLIKSRVVSELAMRMHPASYAKNRGPLLFSDRPLHRSLPARPETHRGRHIDLALQQRRHALGRASSKGGVTGRGGRPVVLCAVGVSEYRAMIPLVVGEGDAVLEVGCHGGTTTRMLAEAVGQGGLAVGVDIGESIVGKARRLNPHVQFEVADGWDSHALVALGGERQWDAVLVDVGGLSGNDGVLEALALLRQLSAAMPSLRALVIKSACMRSYAAALNPANELLPALHRAQPEPPHPSPPALPEADPNAP